MVVAEEPTRKLEGSIQILPRRIELASIHGRRGPVVVERNEALLIRRVLGENQIEGPAVQGHGAVDLTEIAKQPSIVAQGVDEAIPTGVTERFISGDRVFVDCDGSIRVAELLVDPSKLVQGIGDLDITVIEVFAAQLESALDLAARVVVKREAHVDLAEGVHQARLGQGLVRELVADPSRALVHDFTSGDGLARRYSPGSNCRRSR